MNIRIIGVGNVHMSDDGFGPYVARVLEALYELPEYVQIIDGSTPGLELAPHLVNADAVIFVDTVTSGGRSGELHEFRLTDLLQHPPLARLSPHDPGVAEALLTVAAAGMGPREALIVGVVPEWVATGVQLSAAVRAAIHPVIGLITTELSRLGVRLVPRAVPRPPETWWERAGPHAVAS
jgi:hydrogenase maturation protease